MDNFRPVRIRIPGESRLRSAIDGRAITERVGSAKVGLILKTTGYAVVIGISLLGCER